jgi:hypothetical protein
LVTARTLPSAVKADAFSNVGERRNCREAQPQLTSRWSVAAAVDDDPFQGAH